MNLSGADECIDFTMMYVLFFLFVSVYTISNQNNATIFNFCILFDGKLNLVGALGRSKSQSFIYFIIGFKFNTIHYSDSLVIYCTAERHPLDHLFNIINNHNKTQ